MIKKYKIKYAIINRVGEGSSKYVRYVNSKNSRFYIRLIWNKYQA